MLALQWQLKNENETKNWLIAMAKKLDVLSITLTHMELQGLITLLISSLCVYELYICTEPEEYH